MALIKSINLTSDDDLVAKHKVQVELKEWLDRGLYIVEGGGAVDESKYMEWHKKITRKFVGRPNSMESKFQRTISLF